MKIECKYCGSMFDDTLEKCPNCGGTNSNVRRATADQPTTIEGLKEWYESKGLPPYETTRFFIGINYKQPRAFGIYKDENTGNFIVYKNKDNGSRAVRYEGSDEAYAVNELFMRLKQEIIEQKAKASTHVASDSNTGVGQSGGNPSSSYVSNSTNLAESFISKLLKKPFMIFVIILCLFWIFKLPSMFLLGTVFSDNKNTNGYYAYGGNYYYNYYSDWYYYNNADDEWELTSVDNKPDLLKPKKAKEHFLTSYWSGEYSFSPIEKSKVYYDRIAPEGYAESGYYKVDDKDYYRIDPYDNDTWYYYSSDLGDWDHIEYSNVPDELKKEYDAEDFYYVPNWDSSTQITDFADSESYRLYEQDHYVSSSSDDSWDDDSWSSSWDNDDDYDYSWSSSDSWDSGSSDWDSDW